MINSIQSFCLWIKLKYYETQLDKQNKVLSDCSISNEIRRDKVIDQTITVHNILSTKHKIKKLIHADN